MQKIKRDREIYTWNTGVEGQQREVGLIWIDESEFEGVFGRSSTRAYRAAESDNIFPRRLAPDKPQSMRLEGSPTLR